jgi:predicted ATPase
VLAGRDAVRLFVERAAAARPDFALDVERADAVAEICRRLDGMPLAIELAAARTGMLAVDQLAARLDDRFGLLTGGRASLPRQQTLRATIDWSYELLAPPERTLFGRLAVFVGGWTLDAAEQVCAGRELARGQVLDVLGRLVDRSLVTADPRAGRFGMLETIRQYARERLAESGEAQELDGRHARYFLVLAERAELHGPRQPGWLARLDAEHDNLRAAIDWTPAHRQHDLAVRLARALHAAALMESFQPSPASMAAARDWCGSTPSPATWTRRSPSAPAGRRCLGGWATAGPARRRSSCSASPPASRVSIGKPPGCSRSA